MTIPVFTSTGKLPRGIYKSNWEDFYKKYSFNIRRINLLKGLKLLLIELGKAGCTEVYIDGSFITKKELPEDYDLCWKLEGVYVEDLDDLLLNYTPEGLSNIKRKYLGDVRVAEFKLRSTGHTYLQYFQFDRNGRSKGIVMLDPSNMVHL